MADLFRAVPDAASQSWDMRCPPPRGGGGTRQLCGWLPWECSIPASRSIG